MRKDEETRVSGETEDYRIWRIRLEFKEKLAGILALAEGQNGKITVE